MTLCLLRYALAFDMEAHSRLSSTTLSTEFLVKLNCLAVQTQNGVIYIIKFTPLANHYRVDAMCLHLQLNLYKSKESRKRPIEGHPTSSHVILIQIFKNDAYSTPYLIFYQVDIIFSLPLHVTQY